LGLWGCLVVSRDDRGCCGNLGNLGYIGGIWGFLGVVSSCFKLFQVVSRGLMGVGVRTKRV